MALSVTQILMVLGVLQFILLMDDRSVKVTEELLRQHEEHQNQQMVWLMQMEKWIQEQTRLSEESLLLSACQQWWFWASAEILLMLFGFYWLPKKRNAGSDSGSQREASSSAQEQREKEDWEDDPDPYNTQDKPLDKVGTSGAFAKPFPRTTFRRLHPAMRAGSAYKVLAPSGTTSSTSCCSCP